MGSNPQLLVPSSIPALFDLVVIHCIGPRIEDPGAMEKGAGLVALGASSSTTLTYQALSLVSLH